jgi:hypothetical protein
VLGGALSSPAGISTGGLCLGFCTWNRNMMLMDEELMLLIVLVDRHCYIRLILSNPNAVAESNSINDSS